MKPKPPFTLNQADIASGMWMRLSEYLHEELATLRETNDNAMLDPVATARIRGEIARIKKILALAEPAP